MPRGADIDLHWIASNHVDGLLASLEVHPLAVDFVLVWVFRIDFFDVQVHHVRAYIGKAPGDTVIVTDDHAGNSGKGEAGHLDRASVAFRHAVQADLVPDRRHLDAKVRIVCQQRHPGCCA